MDGRRRREYLCGKLTNFQMKLLGRLGGKTHPAVAGMFEAECWFDGRCCSLGRHTQQQGRGRCGGGCGGHGVLARWCRGLADADQGDARWCFYLAFLRFCDFRDLADCEAGVG